MNVLITGSTGFLGKEVSLALKQKKYNIKYISRKRFKNKNYIFCNLSNIKRLKHLSDFQKKSILVSSLSRIVLFVLSGM